MNSPEQNQTLIAKDLQKVTSHWRSWKNGLRWQVEVTPGDWMEVAHYLLKTRGWRLITATATQAKKASDFEIYYHVSDDATGLILNVHVVLPFEKPQIDSIASLTVAANWIEREMHELYGIEFKGHPQMEPLISDGNWEKGEYPFRKQ